MRPTHRTAIVGAPLSRARNLAGIECYLVLVDTKLATQWCAALSEAGARTWERHEPWPAVVGSGMLRVVITDTVESLDTLPTAGEKRSRGFGVVSITAGHRRQPRLIAPGIASLDTPVLRTESLLQAVAMAAGRTMPLLRKGGTG